MSVALASFFLFTEIYIIILSLMLFAFNVDMHS